MTVLTGRVPVVTDALLQAALQRAGAAVPSAAGSLAETAPHENEKNSIETETEKALSASEKRVGGIGTLGEKVLHAALKYALEPDDTRHEVPIGGFVADIAGPQGIVEIQTRAFEHLRKKLPVFLKQGPVTVVYPLAVQKTLVWIDPDTGELSAPRKSPRRGLLSDALPELFALRELLETPGLQVCILQLALTEYRLKNGWSADGKKGSTREQRIPTAVLGQLLLTCPQEYATLLPEGLSTPFTAEEFRRAARLKGRRASAALHVLLQLRVLERAGSRSRAFLYRPVGQSPVSVAKTVS